MSYIYGAVLLEQPTGQDLSSVVSQFVLYLLTAARVLSFDSEAKRVQASHGSPCQQFVYYQAVANRWIGVIIPQWRVFS